MQLIKNAKDNGSIQKDLYTKNWIGQAPSGKPLLQICIEKELSCRDKENFETLEQMNDKFKL